MSDTFTVGEVRILEATEGILSGSPIFCNLRGDTLPEGRYLIRLDRFFYDYETGYRMIGRTDDGAPVYFDGRVWDRGYKDA